MIDQRPDQPRVDEEESLVLDQDGIGGSGRGPFRELPLGRPLLVRYAFYDPGHEVRATRWS